MYKKILITLSFLLLAEIATAQNCSYWFTILTPQPFQVLNKTATAPWVYAPSCSGNSCTYSINIGTPFRFFVTLGTNFQNMCQIEVQTTCQLQSGQGQAIFLLATTSCKGGYTAIQTDNDNYNLQVQIMPAGQSQGQGQKPKP